MSEYKKASAGFWAGATFASLLAAPLLYLLLLGPVYFLGESEIISDDTLQATFYPVIFLSRCTDTKPIWLWSTYEGYLELWGNLAATDRMSR